MVPTPKPIFVLKKSPNKTDTVNYTTLQQVPRTAGAFRVVDADALLWPNPTIRVLEYSNIRFDKNPEPSLKALGKSRQYVAVSHVWDYAFEVDSKVTNQNVKEQLDIDVDAPDGKSLDTKTISWVGLEQVAQACKHVTGGPVKYFWLDFLCLDQVTKKNDLEKQYQLCIMGSIYESATAVITMIGGIAYAQGVTQRTAWMDRAWTLQESILNSQTYICVKWPTSKPNVQKPGKPGKYWKFTTINWKHKLSPPTDSLYLISLQDLLDLTDAQPLKISGVPHVSILDGMTRNAGYVPRRALRACLSADNRIKHTGVWRSMFMRTSSKPVDVVYSIMTIFKIRVDPYRKNRDPAFVFADLARKTAAIAKIGPVWLTLGGITGSELERHPDSLLIPQFPHTDKANVPSSNTPPKMSFKDPTTKVRRWDWVGYHLDDSPWYIKKFHMYFVSHSHPHLVNAVMLKVRSVSSPQSYRFPRPGVAKPAVRKFSKSVQLGSMTGDCTYSGDITGPEVYAVYVGDIGDMSIGSPLSRVEYATRPKRNFAGHQFLLFMRYNRQKGSWGVAGDGVFRVAGRKGWTVPQNCRYMFTVGGGAQSVIHRWQAPVITDPSSMDARNRSFNNNYGFRELTDLGWTNTMHMPINWMAKIVSATVMFEYPKRHGRVHQSDQDLLRTMTPGHLLDMIHNGWPSGWAITSRRSTMMMKNCSACSRKRFPYPSSPAIPKTHLKR